MAETAALPRVSIVIGLGRLAFDAAWRLLADRGIVIRPRPPFGHDVAYETAGGYTVIGSYHPSRQNTNTGKLTPPMMDAVFARARRIVESRAQGSGLKAQARASSKSSKVLPEP
jgi:uracil-DNA glycosylase